MAQVSKRLEGVPEIWHILGVEQIGVKIYWGDLPPCTYALAIAFDKELLNEVSKQN
jgi:hypothetical protein